MTAITLNRFNTVAVIKRYSFCKQIDSFHYSSNSTLFKLSSIVCELQNVLLLFLTKSVLSVVLCKIAEYNNMQMTKKIANFLNNLLKI